MRRKRGELRFRPYAFKLNAHGAMLIRMLRVALTLPELTLRLKLMLLVLLTVGAVKYTVAAVVPVSETAGPAVCVHT